jgi:hypothetical protein
MARVEALNMLNLFYKTYVSYLSKLSIKNNLIFFQIINIINIKENEKDLISYRLLKIIIFWKLLVFIFSIIKR